MSSQAVAATESEPQAEHMETHTSPEATVADNRKNFKKTLEKPRVTFDNLLNDLELCMRNSPQGNLDVTDLEQLTADFATFLTYCSAEVSRGMNEKLDDFYSQLKFVISESIQDEHMTGSQTRKTALKNFAESLEYKLQYFKNLHLEKNDNELSGTTELTGMIGG